jgi:prolipoprotein diacylglyceryltransferase
MLPQTRLAEIIWYHPNDGGQEDKMTPKLLIFLAIGTVLMGIPITLVARKYGIRVWKAFLTTFLLTVFGATGTFVMYFIENGRFGGLSFYGAVFLIPIAFAVVSPVLKIPYGKLLDLCAIGECIMLALMKVHCILSQCCIGRILFTGSDGKVVRFPSREVELAVAIVIFVILLCWVHRGQHCGQLHAWYFILYGSTRFVLNILREAWVTTNMLLPYGNIWSIVAVSVGILWLFIIKKYQIKYHE